MGGPVGSWVDVMVEGQLVAVDSGEVFGQLNFFGRECVRIAAGDSMHLDVGDARAELPEGEEWRVSEPMRIQIQVHVVRVCYAEVDRGGADSDA